MQGTYFKIEDPQGPVFSLKIKLNKDISLRQIAKSQWHDIRDFAEEFETFKIDDATVTAKLKKGEGDTVFIKVFCFLKTRMVSNLDENL